MDMKEYSTAFRDILTRINWISPSWFERTGKKCPGFIVYKGKKRE